MNQEESILSIDKSVSVITKNSQPLIDLMSDVGICKNNLTASIQAINQFVAQIQDITQYKDILRSTTIAKDPALYIGTIVKIYNLKNKFDTDYIYFKDSYTISKSLVRT